MIVAGFDDVVEIGRGGLGVVYSARDATGGRVAIKVLTESLEDGAAFDRLQREVGAMGQLRGHPNVVHVYRADRLPNGQPYLVMEFAEGGSLRDFLKRSPHGLPTDDVARWGGEIGEALLAAHQIGIIHRDVKPDNAFVTKYGHIKLGDFGVALLAWEPSFANRTMAEASSMTIAHGAPEQFDQNQPVGPPADVYALGSTLFELSEGTPPFGRGALGELFTVAERKRSGPSNLQFINAPPHLAQCIRQCLQPNPADRPTAADVAALLSNLSEGGDQTLPRKRSLAPPIAYNTNPPAAVPTAPIPPPPVYITNQPLYSTNPPTQPQVIYVTQSPAAPPQKSRGAGIAVGALVAATLALVGAAIYFATRKTSDSTAATVPSMVENPVSTTTAVSSSLVPITELAVQIGPSTSALATTIPSTAPAITSTSLVVAASDPPPPPTEAPRLEGDLGLPTPMTQPPCDGSYITVLASVRDQSVGSFLDSYPGAAYLRTETTCSSLSPRFTTGPYAGQQIYLIYYGPYSQAEACTNRSLGPTDAYAKRLDTTSPPGQGVAC